MATHETTATARVLSKTGFFSIIIILVGLFMNDLSMNVAKATAAADPQATAFDHSYKKWNKTLTEAVVVDGLESRVRYRALQKSPQELNSFLEDIQALSRKSFDAFSQDQKLAFLINAYNALTLKLILDHYPVDSIKDIGSVFRSAWKIKFFRLFGEQSHLDNIEHDMVRKWFNEPRIHFALVCASKGCPALANEAFTEKNLESKLEAGAINFLRDKTRNRYLPAEKKLEISSIFKWYGGDFEKNSNTLIAFLAPRITENQADQAIIRSGKASLTYLDYDWSLNDQK